MRETIDCGYACLLFRSADGQDFSPIAYLPGPKGELLAGIGPGESAPAASQLKRLRRLLGDNNAGQDSKNADAYRGFSPGSTELAVPLVSRGRLTGILLAGERRSGSYSSREHTLLQDIADAVANVMEKEYLREQAVRRTEELAIINRSSVIMSSSLDIQAIFKKFVKELRKIMNIDWAAVNLIDGDALCLLAVSSRIGTIWKDGERLPLKGTAAEWLAAHKQSVLEPDLTQRRRFVTAEYYLKCGVRSIVHVPLETGSGVIGSLVAASRQADAYSRRKVAILEELAPQITMPIQHSRLYADIVEKIRIDELSGLLNRRAFEEVIVSEINRFSRYGGVFSLMVFDLDGQLRATNNRFGHLAGDELLRQIGTITRKLIRSSDQAFRYGNGDEFAIILPNTPAEAAIKVAERARKQLGTILTPGGSQVTASFGVACCPANGTTALQLIDAADKALYQAKQAGGDQARSAPPS